jgi:copper chaperone CopZ
MEDLTLLVPSIGCQGCMNKIIKKLQTLQGVEITETNVPAKSLALRYAAQEVSPEQIESAIREIGHRVAPGEAELSGKGA